MLQHIFKENCFIVKLSNNIHVLTTGFLRLTLPLLFSYHLAEHWEEIGGDMYLVNDTEDTWVTVDFVTDDSKC